MASAADPPYVGEVGDSGVKRVTSKFERLFGWAACAGSVALLVVAMLIASSADAAQGARIVGANVRLPAVGGRPGAGYFTLDGGSKGDTLTGVASPLASRIELHSNSMAGGVMRMDKLPAVQAGPGEAVRFAPGGNHLMIFGLAASVKPGTTVPLVFSFASGATVKVDASTVAAGAELPMIMGHGEHN